MSVNLRPGVVDQFFQNVQSGKLTQEDPNFSLKDKANLTALKQLISNKKMPFEELSQFIKGIKQIYPGEDKILGKVCAIAQPCLVKSVECAHLSQISDLKAALDLIDAMGSNGNGEELKIQCAKQYLNHKLDLWCTRETVLTHLLSIMKLSNWSDDAKLSLGIAVGSNDLLPFGAEAVCLDNFREQFQDPGFFVLMLMQIEKKGSHTSSVTKTFLMTHAKLIGEYDKAWLAYALKKHVPNNRMDASSLKELMQIDRQFVMDYFSADLIAHRSEISEVPSRLEDRIQLAQKCLISAPETLAKHFFTLFTLEEVHGDHALILTDMMNALSRCKVIDIYFFENLLITDRPFAIDHCAAALMAHCGELPKEIFSELFSLEEKITIAQNCMTSHPQQFAKYLLNLFDAKEICGERASTFNEMIRTACSLLKGDSSEGAKEALSYLENQQLYLERMSKGNQEHINDCHHWDCLGETESGCLVFKLKWIHDPNANEQYRAKDSVVWDDNNENTTGFAVEPTTVDLPHTLLRNREVFESLGFRYSEGPSGVYFTIPKGETLVKNWDALRNSQYAGYPSFSPGESQGIAPTKEFLAILQNHSIVLSVEREFVHDMYIHGMATFTCILENHKVYMSSFEELRVLFSSTFERLEKASAESLTPQEKAALAVIPEFLALLHDLFTGRPEIAGRQNLLSNWRDGSFITNYAQIFFSYLWEHDEWKTPLSNLGLVHGRYGLEGVYDAAESVKALFLKTQNIV